MHKLSAAVAAVLVLAGCAGSGPGPDAIEVAHGVVFDSESGWWVSLDHDGPSIFDHDGRLCRLIDARDPHATGAQLARAGYDVTWSVPFAEEGPGPLLNGPPDGGHIIAVGAITGSQRLPADGEARRAVERHLLLEVDSGATHRPWAGCR